MSLYETEIDERMYEMYVQWCRAHEVRPDIKGFLLWKDEQGYDEDEPDWA